MLQSSARADSSSTADQGAVVPMVGRRERNRIARHRNYLRAAMEIVATDGLDGLTMQRVADVLDCAVGTIYTYFPSKSALVAEVQRAAIEKLTASYLLIRTDTDRLLAADEPSARVAALTRAVGIGRFWAATTQTHHQEAELMQRLMLTEAEVISADDAGRVLPAALRHLDLGRALLDEAVAVGALLPADAWERVVTWVAAINGVVQVSHLSVHDQELLDGVRLAGVLNLDLLRAWGADPDELRLAARHIDALAARGPLAPPVPDPT